MGAREPSLLSGDGTASLDAEPAPSAAAAMGRAREPARREVLVAGFWRRAAATAIDALAVLPALLLLVFVAGRLAQLTLPAARLTDLDVWLDLALAGDPALWGMVGLSTTLVVIYLLVFQTTLGRTLGMRVCRLEVIDVYGEKPSLARAALRTAGYLACAATLGLGFVWIGFDREKRGLHDWLAGTYVIRSGGRK
jgi:uncharacterized RDD family membrane protein YckC